MREAGITPEDTILEIGPGKGALTRELLQTGAHVIAIEKDTELVNFLQKEFSQEIAGGLLHLVSGDIRSITPNTLGLRNGRYIVAANIPYYITGEIMRLFLTASVQPRTMALLVQKEVAQRVISKRESILSLSVKVYGVPHIAAKVTRGNFSPPPSVDSAILIIERISRDFFSKIDEKDFFRLVRAGFSSKRKLLASNLANTEHSKDAVLSAFAKNNIPEKTRAEELSLETWLKLVATLSAEA